MNRAHAVPVLVGLCVLVAHCSRGVDQTNSNEGTPAGGTGGSASSSSGSSYAVDGGAVLQGVPCTGPGEAPTLNDAGGYDVCRWCNGDTGEVTCPLASLSRLGLAMARAKSAGFTLFVAEVAADDALPAIDDCPGEGVCYRAIPQQHLVLDGIEYVSVDRPLRAPVDLTYIPCGCYPPTFADTYDASRNWADQCSPGHGNQLCAFPAPRALFIAQSHEVLVEQYPLEAGGLQPGLTGEANVLDLEGLRALYLAVPAVGW